MCVWLCALHYYRCRWWWHTDIEFSLLHSSLSLSLQPLSMWWFCTSFAFQWSWLGWVEREKNWKLICNKIMGGTANVCCQIRNTNTPFIFQQRRRQNENRIEKIFLSLCHRHSTHVSTRHSTRTVRWYTLCALYLLGSHVVHAGNLMEPSARINEILLCRRCRSRRSYAEWANTQIEMEEGKTTKKIKEKRTKCNNWCAVHCIVYAVTLVIHIELSVCVCVWGQFVYTESE